MTKITVPVGKNNSEQEIEGNPKVIQIDGVEHQIDATGAILDKDGKIFKTKDEVAELLKVANKTPEQIEAERLAEEARKKQAEQQTIDLKEGVVIELDGVELTIDKNGNAVDKDNKVVKTKEELEKLVASNTQGDINYIEVIQKQTNLLPYKEDKPVTYENTTEGLAAYVNDVHKLGVETGKVQFEKELFNQFPVVKQFLNHLILNNGDASNFNNVVDYSKITLTDDEQQWETLYVAEKAARGIPAQEAKDLFKYLKDDKKGKEAAQASLKFLNDLQIKQNKEADDLLAEQRKLEQQEQEKYINTVATIIETKTLKVKDTVYKLPDAIRVNEGGKIVTKTLKDFNDYLSKPIVVKIDGENYTTTQHEYDKFLENNKRTANDDIFEAYRRFTGYDDTQLIANKANQKQAKKVIKLTTRSQNNQSAPINNGKIVLPIK